MVRPMVTSIKHYVQQGIDVVDQGTVKAVVICNALGKGVALTGAAEFEEGSSIKAVFIELWILAGAQQPGSFTLTVEKIQGGLGFPTFATMSNLDDYPNKRNILYTTQGVSPDANGNPVPVVRGWYKIPKGKQRFALGDVLVLTLSANVEDHTFCGVMTYKSYN